MSSRGDGQAFDPTLFQPSSVPEMVEIGSEPLGALDGDGSASGRYESGQVLGEGGMGEVRLCRDARIGRKVALKRLRRGFDSSSDARARFLREARVQGQLEHPAIVPVYDLGVTSEGVEYFTMKRVRGQTLAEVLAEGKLSQRKLLTAFSSVCMAVHYANARGVLHRDLKPANVMLGDFGEVYVLDWGLAKVTGAPEPAHGPTGVEVVDTPSPEEVKTQAGYILGTPGYIAPEVLEGAEPDARSDVYALGAILFEILAGERMCLGKTAPERVAATLAGAMRRPAREAPPELLALCERATARDRGARLPSALALHEAIERYLDGDRDLALRREAAERHAAAALEAFERARVGEGPDAPDRQTAIAEVGQAIALDPGNASAKATLLAVLTTPPRTLPKEAEEELDRQEIAAMRNNAREAIVAYLAFALFLPGVLLMGVRSWTWLVAGITLFAITLGLFGVVARSGVDLPRPFRYGVYLLSCTAVASLSFTWGPYVGVPTLLAVNAMGFAARPRRFDAWLLATGSVLGFLVPLALELAGWVQPSTVFEAGRIVLLSRAVAFPPFWTHLVLFISTVTVLGASILFAARTHVRSSEVERSMHLHLWQLRQLVPRDTHHAARPADPAPAPAGCRLL